MEEAGGLAHAGVGVAGVEDGGLELLAGGEGVGEVEGVEASGDADLLELVLLEGDAPGAAPGEGSEPDVAGLLDGGGAAEDAGVSVHAVAEGDEDVAGDVAEDDGEGVVGDLVGDVVEDEVAVAVGEGDLEGGLDV